MEKSSRKRSRIDEKVTSEYWWVTVSHRTVCRGGPMIGNLIIPDCWILGLNFKMSIVISFFKRYVTGFRCFSFFCSVLLGFNTIIQCVNVILMIFPIQTTAAFSQRNTQRSERNDWEMPLDVGLGLEGCYVVNMSWSLRTLTVISSLESRTSTGTWATFSQTWFTLPNPGPFS